MATGVLSANVGSVNDFLYNLANRALSVDDNVRPRVPSRFEPAASVSALVSDARGATADVEFEDVATNRQAGEGPEALHFSLPQSIKTETSFRAGEQGDSPSSPGGSLPHDDSSVESNLRPAAPPSNENAAEITAESPSTIKEDALLRPTSPLSADDDEIAKHQAGELTPKLITEPPRTSSSDSDNAAGNIRSRLAETLELDEFPARIRGESLIRANRVDWIGRVRDPDNGTLAPVSPTQAQAMLPAKHTRTEQPLHHSRIIAEPTISENVINVTIGRIEVRAASPPPAKSKSVNQAPSVMSLDDYLRQRTGTDRGGGG